MDRGTYDRMRELQRDHWWFVGRRRIIETLLAELQLPSDAKILEVGCGPGGNLSMLRRFGEVMGLEPDEPSRVFAAEATGVCIKGGALPDKLPFEPNGFDLVCAFDVIEHVEADAAAVAALAQLLKPGGHMAVTVPGNPWMWSRHDELHHHQRRYRMAPFRRLFESAGLSIRKASYFNSLLFPTIAAVRAAKMLAGADTSDDDAMPSAAMNRLLAGVFGAERHWLKRGSLPFGVSIVLIAQRVPQAAVAAA